jgi:hypothetical protein
VSAKAKGRKLMLLLAALATLTTVPAEAAENCGRIRSDLRSTVAQFEAVRGAVTPVLFSWRDVDADTKRMAIDALVEAYMVGEHMDTLAGHAVDAACPGAGTIDWHMTNLLLSTLWDAHVPLSRNLSFGEPLPDG